MSDPDQRRRFPWLEKIDQIHERLEKVEKLLDILALHLVPAIPEPEELGATLDPEDAETMIALCQQWLELRERDR